MEEIYQQFTEVVGKTDVSERTLRGILETVYTEGMDEEQTKAALEKGKKLAATTQGQINKHMAELSKLKEELEAAKAKQSANPKEKGGSKGEGVEEQSELAIEIEQIKAELAQAKKERAISAKRAELLIKAKELGVEDEEFCVELVETMSISEDTDTDSVASKILKLYNKQLSNKVDSPTPRVPKGAGGTKKWEDVFKARAPKE